MSNENGIKLNTDRLLHMIARLFQVVGCPAAFLVHICQAGMFVSAARLINCTWKSIKARSVLRSKPSDKVTNTETVVKLGLYPIVSYL